MNQRKCAWCLLATGLFVSGCGKVSPEQQAQRLFDKAQFADSVRVCETIIQDSLDANAVCDAQVLKGRCLINLGSTAQKIGDDALAARHLEQAILALTRAIEFRPEPLPLHQRSMAHEMLGNTDAAYRDSLAAKEIDPEYKSAYTNEFRRALVSPETQELMSKAKLLDGEMAIDGFANNDGHHGGKDDSIAESDDPSAIDNESADAADYSADTFIQRRDASEESSADESAPQIRPGVGLSNNGEPKGDASRLAGENASAENGVPGISKFNRVPTEPLTPPEAETPPNTTFPNYAPFGGSGSNSLGSSSAAPILTQPTTGVTGDYSRLQGIDPNLPTTGYSGPNVGPQPTSPTLPNGGAYTGTGIPNLQPPGLPPLQNPSTGVGSYSPRPSTGIGQSAIPQSSYNIPGAVPEGIGFTGALPYSQRPKYGSSSQPITTPYQAPPKTADPYSSVPRAPTLNDFYVPKGITPRPVPTNR